MTGHEGTVLSSALEGVEWSSPRHGWFNPGKSLEIYILQDLGADMSRYRGKKIPCPNGVRTPDRPPLANRCIVNAIRDPLDENKILKHVVEICMCMELIQSHYMQL